MNLYLLTPHIPEFPCAGGPVIRRLASALTTKPATWFCLRGRETAGALDGVNIVSFPSRKLFYRIKDSLLGYYFMSEIEARRRAGCILDQIAAIKDSILWILCEGEAVNVGYFISKFSNINIHLTFHDAPESFVDVLHGLSRYKKAIYLTRIRRLIEKAHSVDVISESLKRHITSNYSIDESKVIVLHPSFSFEMVNDLPPFEPFDHSNLRRIGFCGSARMDGVQWSEFLTILSRTKYEYVVMLYANKDFFPPSGQHANVKIQYKPYLNTEKELIQSLANDKIHAFYLGLWKDEQHSVFCRTSLSSKLSLYSAIGLPVIYDGPNDSETFKIIQKYDACVSCSSEAVEKLFSDAVYWHAKRINIKKMFLAEFMLERNWHGLQQCLT